MFFIFNFYFFSEEGRDTGGEMEMIKWGLHLFLLIIGEVAWYNANRFGLRIK